MPQARNREALPVLLGGKQEIPNMTGTTTSASGSNNNAGGAYTAPEAPKQRAAEAIKDRVAAAREWAGDAADSAREWAAERGDQIKTAVSDEPTLVIGVSAAAALVIGLAAGIFIGRLTAD